MKRLLVFLILTASIATTAQGQVFDLLSLKRINHKLCGRVVDYTQNHGNDRRIYSEILGRPRDLYVYLPPGYNPSYAYPLIVFLHGADVDEHDFLDPRDLLELDRAMTNGQIPKAIIAAPDGTYGGLNRVLATHSMWVNGRGGRFEDHVVQEVVPFVMRSYSILPGRESHALLGISAGGFGAMSMALKHRDLFGVVATIGGPLNMRYDTCQGSYGDDFNPATFRMRTEYNPHMVIARTFGILPRFVGQYLGNVYGRGPEVIERIKADNPADLLFSTNLQPDELAIYVNYAGRDDFNFDAHAESFAWLAAQRGVMVDLVKDPNARHNLAYIEANEMPAYRWIGSRIQAIAAP